MCFLSQIQKPLVNSSSSASSCLAALLAVSICAAAVLAISASRLSEARLVLARSCSSVKMLSERTRMFMVVILGCTSHNASDTSQQSGIFENTTLDGLLRQDASMKIGLVRIVDKKLNPSLHQRWCVEAPGPYLR